MVALRPLKGNWLRQQPKFQQARIVCAFAHHAAHVPAAPWQAWHSQHPRCLVALPPSVAATKEFKFTVGAVFKPRVIAGLGLRKVSSPHLACRSFVYSAAGWDRVQSQACSSHQVTIAGSPAICGAHKEKKAALLHIERSSPSLTAWWWLTPRSNRQSAASCTLRLTSNVRLHEDQSPHHCRRSILHRISGCLRSRLRKRSGPKHCLAIRAVQGSRFPKRLRRNYWLQYSSLHPQSHRLNAKRRRKCPGRRWQGSYASPVAIRTKSFHLWPRLSESIQARALGLRYCGGVSMNVRMQPNHSVEATNCSKLQFAPHLKR